MLSVSRRIREETAEAHVAAERVAVATGFLADPVAYARYLRALHGFYVGIEASFDAVPELARSIPDLGERKKQGWLAADLAVLHASPPAAVFRGRHPDVASALGAAYVVEGATLGGRWILAHLAPSIPAEARTFYQGYGARTPALFKTMCRALDEHVDAAETVIASAIATFAAMREWIAVHAVP